MACRHRSAEPHAKLLPARYPPSSYSLELHNTSHRSWPLCLGIFSCGLTYRVNLDSQKLSGLFGHGLLLFSAFCASICAPLLLSRFVHLVFALSWSSITSRLVSLDLARIAYSVIDIVGAYSYSLEHAIAYRTYCFDCTRPTPRSVSQRAPCNKERHLRE